MRGIPLVLLVVALPLLAQTIGSVPSASQQPPWMEVFRKIYSPQGQAAPLGSLDQEIENAWATALAAGPLSPFFEPAAQQASQYFASQGYDRKAETILRQAISATGQVDAIKARSLRLALAQRFTQEQKFLLAARLFQEVIEELKVNPEQTLSMRITAITQLAQLREQMGELEVAETLLREAKTLQTAPIVGSSSTPSQLVRVAYPRFTSMTGSFLRYMGPSDLVSFYQRTGETTKAEALLQQEIADAREPQETYRALQNYTDFLRLQQRWEESITQLRKIIALQNTPSRPEDRQMLASSRQNLAQALTMTGKEEEALEILRENVAQASDDAFQRTEALRAYAQMLIQRKQVNEAEKVVEQIRQPIGKNATEASKYTQAMADQLLTNIREIQSRTEEARALRERIIAQGPKSEGSQASVWDLLQPVREAMARHKYDEAMEQAQRVLTDVRPRIHNRPEEISAFTSLLFQLPQGRREERDLFMHTLISVLDGVTPADHPRVAQAFGQLMNTAINSGLNSAEVTRLLERQEKILIATKGVDHPALNGVSRERAQFFSFRGDHAEAAAEMKRAVKRSEVASGPKSQPTLQVMRELANSLQMTNESWPEEEAVRLALIERSGQSGGVVQEMSGLAHRYFAMGQRENALSWIDRAIELTRKNPQAAPFLQQLEQQRSNFTNTQNQSRPNANPFYGGPAGRWFDSTGFSSTQGTRIGNRSVSPPK